MEVMQHATRIGQLRESFAEANERLVARLRGASDEAAERLPAGRLVGGADRLACRGRHDAIRGDDRGRRAGGAAARRGLSRAAVGRDVAASIPDRARGTDAAVPPPAVRRDRCGRSAGGGRRAKMARAFDGLSPERGDRMGITQSDRRHDQRLPARGVGDRPRHPPQQAGEAGARPGANSGGLCDRPQRRRFRNSPFLEIPSIRAASSTRPCDVERAPHHASVRAGRRRPASG